MTPRSRARALSRGAAVAGALAAVEARTAAPAGAQQGDVNAGKPLRAVPSRNLSSSCGGLGRGGPLALSPGTTSMSFRLGGCGATTTT